MLFVGLLTLTHVASAAVLHDDIVHDSGQWRMESPHHVATARRLDGSYSWGAGKDYSVPFDPTFAHTHGGKTMLVTLFKPEGASCEGCDSVISPEELSEIITLGNRSIMTMSYGAAWISTWTVVPSVMHVTEGNFFTTVDNLREASYAAGYDFSQYDFDIHWKRATGSTGGSAIPGGRAQRYSYDGSLSSFTGKIFPHEFLHNFGTGHANFKGSTYGDPYDITGGGFGDEAHVSAAVKHRWGWINDAHVLTLTPEGMGGTTRTIRLRAFDTADAPSAVRDGELLTVRLATRFVGSECDPRYSWCPDWSGSPWIGVSDHYLYISFRAAYPATARGASLHMARYSSTSWVDATALLPIRPAGGVPGVVEVGETYVFDGPSSLAISIHTRALSDGVLIVEVGYVDGVALKTAYEGQHAAALCSRNLACGQEVVVQPTSYDVVDATGAASVLVRVGETHALRSRMQVCANSSGAVVPPTVYAYDEFPLPQILYQAPLAINAQVELADTCSEENSLVVIDGTGVW